MSNLVGEGASFTIEPAHNTIGQLDFGVDECDIKHYIDSRIETMNFQKQ